MDVKTQMIEFRNAPFSSRVSAAHALASGAGPAMPEFLLPDAGGHRLPSAPSGTRQ